MALRAKVRGIQRRPIPDYIEFWVGPINHRAVPTSHKDDKKRQVAEKLKEWLTERFSKIPSLQGGPNEAAIPGACDANVEEVFAIMFDAHESKLTLPDSEWNKRYFEEATP